MSAGESDHNISCAACQDTQGLDKTTEASAKARGSKDALALRSLDTLCSGLVVVIVVAAVAVAAVGLVAGLTRSCTSLASGKD